MKTLIVLITTLVLISSCKTEQIFKASKYKESDSSQFELLTHNYQHILSPDDKLSVSIWNHDDLSIGSVYSIYNTNEAFGKWVLIESDSTAAIPYIGTTIVGGMSLNQAEELIKDSLGTYIKNPIVELRVLNREVTMLGELNAPGNYLLEKEISTLVEYLGKAQGLTYYANTKKVQIIRNEISYTVDLRKLKEFSTKNIFLQAGDIIYIPAKRGKNLVMKAPVLIPFASLITSLGVLISVLPE